jgi:hypothetical protein
MLALKQQGPDDEAVGNSNPTKSGVEGGGKFLQSFQQ